MYRNGKYLSQAEWEAEEKRRTVEAEKAVVQYHLHVIRDYNREMARPDRAIGRLEKK